MSMSYKALNSIRNKLECQQLEAMSTTEINELLSKMHSDNTALREELAALKAYNSALVSAKTAFIDSEQWEGEAGYLRPDNAEEMLNAAFNKTPAQSLAKVRADAIRDAAEHIHLLTYGEAYDYMQEHANKIEAG